MAQQEPELNITNEEMERFQKAMKNEEFRKMFCEYAKEISDPENKKKYEAEIAQLEAERGIDVKFINPQDGFVIKTSIKSESGMKAFINVCQSDAISEATCKEGSKTVDSKNVKGQEWSIPYSLNQPREDLDRAGKNCKVYDVIFHTKTYQMGQKDPRFKQLIINTAFDAIEGNWKVKLDRKNLKYPKMKFKGTKTSTVIRTSSNEKGVKDAAADIDIGGKKLPYPYKHPSLKPFAKEDANESTVENCVTCTSRPCAPKYVIIHRGHVDLQNFTNARDSRASTRPEELVINIELPLCATSTGVDLDIFERQLVLDCSDPNYHLDLTLPYPVNENEGRATFDKSKRTLIVTLPVLPASLITLNGYEDDETASRNVDGLVTEIVDERSDCRLDHGEDEGGCNDGECRAKNGECGRDSGVYEDSEGDCNDQGGTCRDNDFHCTDNDSECNAKECESGFNYDNRGGNEVDHGDNDGKCRDNGDNCSDENGNYFGKCPGTNGSNCSVEDIQTEGDKCKKFFKDVEQKPNDAYSNCGLMRPVFHTPPYSFHQNEDTVTFILKVPNVSLDTMSLGFNANECCISFPYASATSTDIVSHGYALYIQFPEECLIDSETSSIDLNETNLVLVLCKRETCVGLWKSFMIGSDEHALKKKIFLTEETLKECLGDVPDNWPQLEPLTISHKIESATEETTVIQVDVERESVAADMGNIMPGVEAPLFGEVKNESTASVAESVVDSTVSGDIKNGGIANDNDTTTLKDDAVIVNYQDLEETEVIEEDYAQNENEAVAVNASQKLTTVQEIEPTNKASESTAGSFEMQKARATKCRKNARRRRRSTGSHDQRSSVSEEEIEGSTKRGKQSEKHARRSRKSRSLSFGSSVESFEDVDGHRCVRFNPVPEVHVFSNRADKRKWKEQRRNDLLQGKNDRTQSNTNPVTISRLKSSLKDPRSSTTDKVVYSVSSDDGNSELVTEDLSIEIEKHLEIDEGDKNTDDNEDVFPALVKPQLTNPLIFDLDE